MIACRPTLHGSGRQSHVRQPFPSYCRPYSHGSSSAHAMRTQAGGVAKQVHLSQPSASFSKPCSHAIKHAGCPRHQGRAACKSVTNNQKPNQLHFHVSFVLNVRMFCHWCKLCKNCVIRVRMQQTDACRLPVALVQMAFTGMFSREVSCTE